MSYFPKAPLYGVIAANGALFTITYHGTESTSGSRQGYSLETFDGCPPDMPVVDFRTCANFGEVWAKCCGTHEAQVQPYDPAKDAHLPEAFRPVPLSQYLEYCRNAGATVRPWSEYIEEMKWPGEDENNPFRVHGTYCVSNAGGYEVQISRNNDSARVREAYGSENPRVSRWFEIQHVPDEDNPEETAPVIDPEGLNIPLSLVMRANW